jgi:excisionase family DNA binding protein
MDKILTTKQAAEYLQVSERTLQRWRDEGRGPKYQEPEPRVIRYVESQLKAWVEQEDTLEQE